ncbi:MAG TPA: zinc ribbon domain-containing protein [Candidatus Dormibacteraeota bacterium]|nr:zinc ribbon domain-containing protein [Candidatus Dormibacteraeota bacterium]
MNGMAPNMGPGSGTSAWQERMRLIRFRRKRESLRFWNEFKLIPRWVIGLVVVLFLLAQGIALVVNLDVFHVQQDHQIFPPDLQGNPVLASWALAALVTGMSLVVASIIFMAVYVNQDAKRRGMNSAVWTLVYLILIPGYFVLGFIIYLLMREPLPYPCPKCSATVGARFNFCPNCKCNLHPACPQCKQEVAETDRFCPNCAYELAPQRASDSEPSVAG